MSTNTNTTVNVMYPADEAALGGRPFRGFSIPEAELVSGDMCGIGTIAYGGEWCIVDLGNGNILASAVNAADLLPWLTEYHTALDSLAV